MLNFNKIVNKLWNKWWKILFKKDIFEIIDPECKKCYEAQVNKIVYQLKAQQVIVPLKSWVYIVPTKEDMVLNQIDLLENYYMKLLKKYITFYVWGEYYIAGWKSLEFHLKDFSVPEKIYIVNRTLSKKIKVWGYEIIFKTLAGKYQGKKINLYNKLTPMVKSVCVEDVSLKIACLELALLEAALVSDSENGLSFDILNKTIKKYGKVLETEKFYEIGKYKYAMSFNRLKEIAKPINYELSQVFLDVIKKNGNLFIGEGLRGF